VSEDDSTEKIYCQKSLITDQIEAHVRHATKSNSVAQLCCSTKLPVWHRELPNFWRVQQLNC